ncbi:hypothetical protein [Cohnella sp. 56]|uniref:hypothetical protein n=1 Tax=Cohnella sp. 56 TaxID=3113722 RepID=UPI0030EAC6B6
MSVTFVVLCLAATVLFGVSSYLHVERTSKIWAAERRDMLDRLMSKDLVEYKQMQPAAAAPKSEPIDMTDEEEWAREIEMQKSGAG